jgi:hypothetical protein
MDWIDLARDSKIWNGGGGAWTGLIWLGTVECGMEEVEQGLD